MMHSDDVNVPPQGSDQRLHENDNDHNDHNDFHEHGANDVRRDPYGRDDVLVASAVETDRDTGPHTPPPSEQDAGFGPGSQPGREHDPEDGREHDPLYSSEDGREHDPAHGAPHDSEDGREHDSEHDPLRDPLDENTTATEPLDPDHDATRDVTRDPLQDPVEPEDTAVSTVTPVEEKPSHAAPPAFTLFEADPAEVQSRWRDVQASFVDDPSEAVQRADGLVGEVVDSVTNALRSRTGELRESWKSDGGSDTERLRQALREYRGVLEGLLALSGGSSATTTTTTGPLK